MPIGVSPRHHQVGGQQHPRDQEEHGGRHAKPGRPPDERFAAVQASDRHDVRRQRAGRKHDAQRDKADSKPRREACRRRVTLSPSDFPQKQPESRHHETETHKSQAGSYPREEGSFRCEERAVANSSSIKRGSGIPLLLGDRRFKRG